MGGLFEGYFFFFVVPEWGLLKSLRSKESTKQMGEMKKLKSWYQRQRVRLGKNESEGVWFVEKQG